ncbi:MAG: amidohydrolase family protein [Armatimonadota bacterium]|nr:amidohydrolase family protein [Armatimonadota bacterium]
MIVDADVHISPTLQGGNSIGVEELLRRMDRAGVDQALAWLQPPYTRYTDESNAYVFHAMKRHPDRILGFGWADPNLGVEEAKETVRRCVQEYGFYGVKLNGAQNSFYIDDPELALPVIEEIARLGTVLAFHVGADDFERTHPFRVAKVARRFPELRILMVHMGGVGHHDVTHAAVEFAEECPNLTLIGSAVRTTAILRAIRRLGPFRVCFGSDTPFELMHVEVARYRALLEGEVTAEGWNAVMGGNIRRVLGVA